MAVVDWDVHHGNGTQSCFYERDDVLTISLHMRHGSWGPSHPETGSPAEVGAGKGAGYNVNVELRPGSGDGAYVEAFRRIVEPVLDQYRPEALIGASGQDASAFDGNGRMNLSMDGFHAIGAGMRASADRSGAKLLLIQEGGYARTYAAYCLHATLEGLLGVERLLEDPLAYLPDDPAARQCRHRRGLRRAQSLGFALTRELPFSEDEYRDRARRVREEMRRREVDVLFVMSPANLCYLTGFESIWYPPRAPLGVVVSRHDERLLFMDYERHETLVARPRSSTTASSIGTRTRSTRSRAPFGTVVGTRAASESSGGRRRRAHPSCARRPARLAGRGSAGRGRRLDRRPRQSGEDASRSSAYVRKAAEIVDAAFADLLDRVRPGPDGAAGGGPPRCRDGRPGR